MFEPLPDVPDHPALELELLDTWERERTFERLREQNAGSEPWSFVDGPVTANKKLAIHTAWGRTLKDVFQRYKALRGYDQRYQNGFDCQGLWIEVGVERDLGLNSKREIEEYGLDRVRGEVPRGRRLVVRGDHARVEAPRHVDGLGQGLLHLQRHEHRVHLAVPEARPRAGLALPRPPLDGVVPALRDVDLGARAARELRRPGRPVALRPLPAPRPARRVARRLDDDAVDAARERRRRREPGRGLRAPAHRRVGRRAALPGRAVRRGAEGLGARRLALRGAVRRPRAGRGRRAPRDPVGRGLARGGHRDRPHRARRRLRGLRALARARPAGADAGGRVRALLRRLRLAARPLDRRGRGADHRPARGARAARRVGPLRAPLPRVLALPHAAHLPHLGRLVHLRPRPARADARGQRGREVDARVHGQAHGRLAREHGRLEHLPPPLLRAAAAVLPLRLRPPERDRLARRARGTGRARARRAAGAAAAVDRRRARSVRVLRGGGAADPRGRRRLARRRDRPVLDARLAEPGVGARGLRHRRGEGADDRRPARPRLLGEVVPRRLGLGDARADPALVLLAALHVGRARRAGAVRAGARLREDARRDGPGDARLVGEHDRGGGRVRADGRGRDALAVLRAAARPEPPLRLRARRARSSASC